MMFHTKHQAAGLVLQSPLALKVLAFLKINRAGLLTIPLFSFTEEIKHGMGRLYQVKRTAK